MDIEHLWDIACYTTLVMIFIIIFLFLLDVIIHMIINMFGINFKKMLGGMGIGFGFMAMKDWYKKHNLRLTENDTENHD